MWAYICCRALCSAYYNQADEEEIHVFRNASFKSLGLCCLLQYEIYSQTMVSIAVFHILLNTPKNFQLQIHLINVLLKSITHPRSTFNASFTQARRWNCDYKKVSSPTLRTISLFRPGYDFIKDYKTSDS